MKILIECNPVDPASASRLILDGSDEDENTWLNHHARAELMIRRAAVLLEKMNDEEIRRRGKTT